MIEPALTPEEWAELRDTGALTMGPFGAVLEMDGTVTIYDSDDGYTLQQSALAALCLHDQPSGFTREDVTRHRNRAKYYRENLAATVATWDFPQAERDSKRRHGEWHESMADRIEALLPPEE